jgi:hypothetical protein
MQNLPTWTTIGFTGHRRLENPPLIAEAIRQVVDELQAKCGPLSALSSAASGADTLFVEEVARRGLPFFLIFPFSQDRFRQDFSAEDWERVAAHFDKTLDIDEVRYCDSDNEAYLECGLRTVDRCDVLIAVWNGEVAAGKGGTGDVVAYTRSLGKPLLWIDALSGEVHRELFEMLSPSGCQSPGVPDRPWRDLVKQQSDELDKAAEQHSPTARQLVLYIILLHLLATAVAITGYVLDLPDGVQKLFTIFKLGALGGALYLAAWHHRAHHHWMNMRLGAEICRSYQALWPLRRRGARLLSVASVGEQGNLIRSLRMAWYLDRSAEQPLEQARDLYIQNRVRDQKAYFQRKYGPAVDRAKYLRWAATTCTVAALATGILTFFMPDHSGWEYKITKLLTIVLPLVPPALLSLLVAHDMSRRAHRFYDLTEKLEQSEKRLANVRTWPGLWREVVQVERLIIYDNDEWYSMTRFAAEAH